MLLVSCSLLPAQIPAVGVTERRKVSHTGKRVFIGMASLIPVSYLFILGPISCSNNTESLAVILVKLLKGVHIKRVAAFLLEE